MIDWSGATGLGVILIRLALKNYELPLIAPEVVLEDVLHSVQLLLCTATNTTPQEHFFNFRHRSGLGESLRHG